MPYSLKTFIFFIFPFRHCLYLILRLSFAFTHAINSLLIQDTQPFSTLVRYQLATFSQKLKFTLLRSSRVLKLIVFQTSFPISINSNQPKLISVVYPIPYFGLSLTYSNCCIPFTLPFAHNHSLTLNEPVVHHSAHI